MCICNMQCIPCNSGTHGCVSMLSAAGAQLGPLLTLARESRSKSFRRRMPKFDVQQHQQTTTQHRTDLCTRKQIMAAQLLFRIADVARLGFGVNIRISSESDSQVSTTAALRSFVMGVATRRTSCAAEACCIPEASAGLGSRGERSCQVLNPHGLANSNL